MYRRLDRRSAALPIVAVAAVLAAAEAAAAAPVTAMALVVVKLGFMPAG